MRNVCALFLLLVSTAGCAGSLGGLSRILFTNTAASDAEILGIAGTFQETPTVALADLPEGLPVGGILPVTPAGFGPCANGQAGLCPLPPFLVKCFGEMAATCRGFAPNTRVRVSGAPDARGMIEPTRISEDRR